MKFIRKLQKNISAVTNGYFANWTPDNPVAVGDYGAIKDFIFIRDGNVKSRIESLSIESERKDTAVFERKYGVSFHGGAKGRGGLPEGNASLKINFKYKGSFLYHLKAITNNQFKERRVAFEKICTMILSQNILWLDHYVLITEVKQAERAIVLVANSSGSEVEVGYSLDNFCQQDIGEIFAKAHYQNTTDSIVKYEIDEKTAILYRAVSFVGLSPDGEKYKLSDFFGKLFSRSWNSLPAPQAIKLSEYTEKNGEIEGTFSFTTSHAPLTVESIRIRQEKVDFISFREKNKNQVIPRKMIRLGSGFVAEKLIGKLVKSKKRS